MTIGRQRLNDLEWHTVYLTRRGDTITLKVDDNDPSAGMLKFLLIYFPINCVPPSITKCCNYFSCANWICFIKPKQQRKTNLTQSCCLQKSDNSSNIVKIRIWHISVRFSSQARDLSPWQTLYWLNPLYFSVAFSSSYVKVMNIKLLLLGSPGPLLSGNYMCVFLSRHLCSLLHSSLPFLFALFTFPIFVYSKLFLVS
jgi:hypothetical protein